FITQKNILSIDEFQQKIPCFRRSYLEETKRKGQVTTKKGISKSKPSSRKAPPKHAATQVSDATQREMLISHDSLDVNGKGARRRRIRHTTILSTIGEARARAWQVATPPVAIGQGMYISVFGAREPETGRILALKKARGSKRYMQDKSNKVEKDHERSYIWWLMVKRVL
ncbi:hypothetical protein HID58_068767, partial [Brassica napus]